MVGGTGALIQLGIIYLLTEKARLWYMMSTVIGIGVALCWTFTANYLWTFKNEK